MAIEYKACFSKPEDGWCCVRDVALPVSGSILFLRGFYWRVADVIQHPAEVALGERISTPEALLVKAPEYAFPLTE
jgi:hypothetical protein